MKKLLRKLPHLLLKFFVIVLWVSVFFFITAHLQYDPNSTLGIRGSRAFSDPHNPLGLMLSPFIFVFPFFEVDAWKEAHKIIFYMLLPAAVFWGGIIYIIFRFPKKRN